MPVPISAVLCESVAVDMLNGRPTYIGAVDVVLPVGEHEPQPDDPFEARYVVTPLTLVVLWLFDEAEIGMNFEVSATVSAPDGKTKPFADTLGFVASARIHRTVQRSPHFFAHMEGVYSVKIGLREPGEEAPREVLQTGYLLQFPAFPLPDFQPTSRDPAAAINA